MPVRRVIAHPAVSADQGLVAIERGPVVYCIEGKDNAYDAASVSISDTDTLTAEYEEDFFSGAVTITSDSNPTVKLIPYYLHANRGGSWMRVWINRN